MGMGRARRSAMAGTDRANRDRRARHRTGRSVPRRPRAIRSASCSMAALAGSGSPTHVLPMGSRSQRQRPGWWLHSTVARTVRCRDGESRPPPSAPSRGSRPARISAGLIAPIRAAASSIASGRRSSRSHRLAIQSLPNHDAPRQTKTQKSIVSRALRLIAAAGACVRRRG